MIEVEGLTKLYGDFAAVADLGFQVQPGELLGLVGPNGAGQDQHVAMSGGYHTAESRIDSDCGP
jgi:ABC-type uncharacterized transport system ATPase subunit